MTEFQSTQSSEEDAISRTKKVLNMVDGYFYNQNSATRGDLRKHLMEDFEKITRLEATLSSQAEQIRKLEDRVLRVLRGEFTQICSYCGWESPSGGWDALQAHIKVCPEHPLAQANTTIAALEARIDEADGQDGWTCFHCEEHFITRTHALLHFGQPHTTALPACQIKAGAEQGLVKYIRTLEKRLADYQQEDSAILRDAALQRCEKANAVKDAEDLGYSRGLAAQQAITSSRELELLAVIEQMRDSMQEVIRISDRKHDAWDRAKEALALTPDLAAIKELKARVLEDAAQHFEKNVSFDGQTRRPLSAQEVLRRMASELRQP